MKTTYKIIILIIIIAAAAVAAYFVGPKKQAMENQAPVVSSSADNTATSSPISNSVTAQPAIGSNLAEPISNALARVTKKPFGIYVTPQNSPVSPEKFTGYHTGTDFETTPAEQNIDVAVYAMCDGKLLMKKYASGYGGVAVQTCVIDNNSVTIIYGHLRLASIIPNVDDTLKAGQQIAVLGTGYSSETDGERKHLHLGIHKGTAVNILGYVQNKNDLGGWIDAMTILK